MSKELVIEGEFYENGNEENLMGDEDQMKSGTIFKSKIKDQSIDMGIKNNESLANCLYSIDSLNNTKRFSELERQLIDEKNKNKELNEEVKELEKE